MKRFGAFLADDPYFTRPMRDILYIDSQEEFRFYPRKPRPGHEDTAIAVTVGKAPQTLDILIFSHDLTESGAPRAAFDVARTLKDAGHFVVVASPSDGPHRERLRDVGVDVIVDELLLSQDRHVLAFARNFDKVICNTIVCWPAVEQLHEVVDTYWYVHEGELIRHFVETVPGFLEVLNQGISTWAACPLAARVLATYGVAPRVIEYGIGGRAELHLPPNRGAEKIVIGVFGSYEGRKGQDLAIHGMLGISEDLRSKAELRLFGRTQDVKFHDELKQVVSGDHSIVLFGEVDHDECLKQMAACDVILVPSRDDPLPFVALDALSLGKVLVCSKTTGVSEYLEDGQSGLILRENTPEEIARVLESVITNSQLRATLGGGAREVYERTFSVQKFAEKLHSALGLWMTLGDGGQLTPCYPFPPLFAE